LLFATHVDSKLMPRVAPTAARKANSFALAANSRSQWHHSHGGQANAARKANSFALAANDRGQCHHGHGGHAYTDGQGQQLAPIY